jgi:DNA-binding MarR family transcriptional regulator
VTVTEKLSAREHALLAALAQGPALAGAIGRRAGLSGGGTASTLRRLVRLGLAETRDVVQVLMPGGRETVAYAITDAGRAAIGATK